MNLIVPLGSNTATVKALDANGGDVTASCTFLAESSDPTVIQIGNPDATTPNVIPFTALMAGSTANITYTATDEAGSITATDTLTVSVNAPASLTIVYGAVLPPVTPTGASRKK
jgi:hypothetical protein